jgi:sugar-specific transcriptional regulator TrmB
MSDTPRTDAAEFDFDEDCVPENNMVVASCIMAELERELNEANAQLRSLKLELKESYKLKDSLVKGHLELGERLKEAKADADALVLLLGSIMREIPTNKDWLDPALERSANEALETYRNKYQEGKQ